MPYGQSERRFSGIGEKKDGALPESWPWHHDLLQMFSSGADARNGTLLSVYLTTIVRQTRVTIKQPNPVRIPDRAECHWEMSLSLYEGALGR